jgi:ATP-dependent DNA helicase RecQ
MSKKDTLAILPTGGGKSICYQVPAMLLDGLCLVFTPLISLMKDQVLGLHQQKIPALVMHSGMSSYEIDLTFNKAASGNYKFLFVAPERIQSAKFLDLIEQISIGLVVVDEAHCISQWGYDFRPPYLKIGEYRNIFGPTPLLALTASAIPAVQRDIVEKLHFNEHQVFATSIVRNNLCISVKTCQSKSATLLEIVERFTGTILVYCKNRGTVNKLADFLTHHGHAAAAYHAGMDYNSRNATQDAFMQNTARVICCTNAFGMGINKADVRCVVHFDSTDSIEAYYQEIGRAGRDGKNSWAILLQTLANQINIAEKVAQQFPNEKFIFSIYNSLCDYLRIGIDEGASDYYEFNIIEFIKSLGLDTLTSINALKLLELHDLIKSSEGLYIPARLRVLSNHSDLTFLAAQHPHLNHVLKSILRLYAGILHDHISINLRKIAEHADVDALLIQQYLIKLNALGYIDYVPAKDKPQIWLTQNRLREFDFRLDQTLLLFLRKRYEEQLLAITNYTQLTLTCRMQALAEYFGESNTLPCMKCDNCIAIAKKQINQETFNNLHLQINTTIKEAQNITLKQLLSHFNIKQQADAIAILNYLFAENKCAINNVGVITTYE